VLVERLPRLDTAATPHADRGLRETISAANAPGVRTEILVTRRAGGDPELRAVRRSGIPYAILRPHPLVERMVLVAAPAEALAVSSGGTLRIVDTASVERAVTELAAGPARPPVSHTSRPAA
jgi:hypothetical protein